MKKKILLGLVAVLVVFVIYVSQQPDTFRVARSASMRATPEIVFNEINSLKSFATWSPWDERDPNMQRTFSGPEAGVGATYAWSGETSGKGEMSITESVPPERVRYALRFAEPFESEAKTTFTVTPDGEGAKVTWALEGENNFLGKLMCVFFDMDAMTGPDFEKGLANLAKMVEAKGAPTAQP